MAVPIYLPSPFQFVRQHDKAPYQDMVFETTAERTSFLTSPRRYAGMIVVDLEEDASYFLNAAKDAWVAIGSSGGSGATAHLSFTSDDFESDGRTILNDKLISGNISVFSADISNFLYTTKGQFAFVSGGIEILLSGFNANVNDYNIEVFLKATS